MWHLLPEAVMATKTLNKFSMKRSGVSARFLINLMTYEL